MAMSLGDVVVNIRSDTSQLVAGFNSAESAVTKTTQTMTSAVKTFAAAYVGLSSIDLAKTLVRQADAMTNVNSKLQLATSSTQELMEVQKEVYKLSQDTRTSFLGNIDLYQRMAMSTRDLNLSQKQLLDINRYVNESLIISGTSAEGASALIVQLGQAFSSDFKAIAQELGTLRDQAPRLFQAIILGTGMTQAQFKKAAEEGKLSSQIIIDALEKQGIAIDKDFGKIAMTSEQAWTTVGNATTQIIGKFNEATGATSALASGFSSLAQYVDSLDASKIEEYAPTIQGVATAMVVMYTASKLAAWYEALRAISVRASTEADAIATKQLALKTAMEEADTKAIQLGAYAQEARRLADEAAAAAAGTNTAIRLKEAEIIQANTLAQELGTKAVNIRRLADEAELVAKQSGLLIAEKQAKILVDEAIAAEAAALAQTKKAYAIEANNIATKVNISQETILAKTLQEEATSAEAAALAQTAHARSLQQAGLASVGVAKEIGLMGTVMRAVPFLAVAGLVATLATEFFNAKNESNSLNDALDVTKEKLDKLTESQMAYQKILLSKQLQESKNKIQELTPAAKGFSYLSVIGGSLTDEEKAKAKNDLDFAIQQRDKIQAAIDEFNNYKKEASSKTSESTKQSAINPQKIDKKAIEQSQKEALKSAKEFADLEQKIFDDQIQSGISRFQADIENKKKYDDEIFQLTASDYEKQQRFIEDKAQSYIDAGRSEVEVARLVSLEKEAILEAEYQKATTQLDALTTDYTSFYDSISELQNSLDFDKDILSGWNDFGANLDGIAGKIGNVMKVQSDMTKNNQKFISKDLDLQKKYAKAFLDAHGDINKEKYAQSVFDSEQAKLKESQNNAEIAAYSALAGAMASTFQQGSAGAIAFTALQSALGIASSWAAIANAWALPFPANIPAVAMVSAAVLPIISQLGGSGGGGGGGGALATAQTYSQNAKFESDQSNAIVERLDRTNELLESIDQGGTAAKTKVSIASSQFDADIAAIWADMIGTSQRSLATFQNIDYTGNALKDVQSVIEWMDREKNNFRGVDWKFLESSRSTILEYQSSLEQAVSDFASNLSDVRDTVKESSQSFKDIYDELSGTDYYKIRDLDLAVSELGNSIVGNSKDSMLSYMQNAVNQMESLSASYVATTKEMLQNGTIDEQVQALQTLSEAFNTTFNNSSEVALNFLDSIELVAKAMSQSQANIKTFEDSLKTSDQLLAETARSLGVTVATSMSQLMANFEILKKGNDGLNDQELEFLNQNKDALEEKAKAESDLQNQRSQEYQNAIDEQSKQAEQALTDFLNKVKEGITSLNSTITSMTGIIDKLRGSSEGSAYTLEKFNEAMSKSLSLSGSNDYSSFGTAIKDAITYSSALFDQANFTTSKDMQFAQAVAANQFEDMQDVALTQVDYLKMIEENTRAVPISTLQSTTTSNINYDMYPSPFSPVSIQSTVSQNQPYPTLSNSAIISELQSLKVQNNELLKVLIDSKNIQNGAVIQLEKIYNVTG